MGINEFDTGSIGVVDSGASARIVSVVDTTGNLDIVASANGAFDVIVAADGVVVLTGGVMGGAVLIIKGDLFVVG